MERDNELLSLSGLGDRKPTGLLRHIRSLNADPETLLRALFLAQLPVEVRRVLAGTGTIDLDELAVKADCMMEAARSDRDMIRAVKHHPSLSSSEGDSRPVPLTVKDDICFFHKKFGLAARKCTGKTCRFNGLPATQLIVPSSPSGNGQAGR